MNNNSNENEINRILNEVDAKRKKQNDFLSVDFDSDGTTDYIPSAQSIRNFSAEPVADTQTEERENDNVSFPESNKYIVQEKEKKEQKFLLKNDIFDLADSIVKTVIAVVVVFIFLFRVNEVDGISMQPTLADGEKLLVYEFMYTPSYGDVIILYAPNLIDSQTGNSGEPIVKRVIGLAGDAISIGTDGYVYRNGEKLEEDYIAELIDASHHGNTKYPVTVPEGCVFVLGDNRNHSTDSRFIEDKYYTQFVGCVETKYIVGRAVAKIWPLSSIGEIK